MEFDEARYDKAYPEGIERHYWHRARNAVLAATLRREGLGGLGFVPPNTRGPRPRLLEIGCGRGLVTEALRDLGFDCHGVELADVAPAPRVAPFVRVATAFADLPLAEREAVRGALLLDVIEHVEEPVAFLVAIREALPNLERLVVTVPARRELWSRWDDFYGHRCRYDRAILRRELTSAGFRERSSRYFFHGLYPLAYAINAVGASRSTDLVAPGDSLFHRLAGRWFAMEARALPGFMPGTSLLAVAAPARKVKA